jgi:peptidoglycan/LPS O-acetylase OafA/YrhL
MSISYRPDIDGLRALAIILVVIFHAFPNQLPGGFIGVDVFFVISGYLISTIIYEQLALSQFSFIDFYIRRIKRIFPALLVVILSCFAFGWFNLLADEFKQLGKHLAGGAGFIANWVLWSESGYFDRASEAKVLLHLWSLGVEEQFYLLWPFLLYFCWKCRISILGICTLIGVASFAINLWIIFGEGNPSSAFYLPQARFWELMIGSGLAYAHANNSDKTESIFPKLLDGKKNVISMFGFAGILAGAFLISKEKSFPGFWALLPVLGSAAIIAAGPQAWLNQYLFSRKSIVWIGLISYPLYLWHWPLFSFEYVVYGEKASVPIRLLTILVAILLAALTYYLIERPIRFGAYARTKALILMMLMAATGFLGYNAYARDGLVFRLKHVQFRLPESLKLLAENPEKPIDHFASANEYKIASSPQEKSLYLWGDSYAGHLVAGYQKYKGKEVDVVTLPSGCPPIFNTELANRKNCPDWVEKNFVRVLKERPDRIVLAANWTDYPNWAEVEKMIRQLQANGFNQIDLVGPAPQWKDTLYKQLYLEYAFHHKGDVNYQAPYRMQFGLKSNFFEIEPQMKALAQKLGVRYLSIVAILCNQDGCITRFGDTAEQLASFDGGHLTRKASEYVVERFPK